MRIGLCAGGPLDGQIYTTKFDCMFLTIPVLRKDCYVADYEWQDKINIWLWRGPNDLRPRREMI